MTEAMAWDWEVSKDKTWLNPSEESYYLATRWKKQGRKSILDLGCGLGRHAILFAKNGFSVCGVDLSSEGISHMMQWAEHEHVQVDSKEADMMSLPFPNDSFDCVFAFHVIYHCDTQGMRKVIEEMKRVLKPGGELFCTLYSKDTLSYRNQSYPKVDDNTLIKMEEGPEKGIPHFFADLDDVLKLFSDFRIIEVRHKDDCYHDNQKHDFKHYFVLAEKTV